MDFCFIASIVFLFTIIHEGYTKNCTHVIPHGEVTWWCSAVVGNMCPYSCDKGYEKNQDAAWISCSSSGEWRPFIHINYMSAKNICLPKSCPQMIPNGKLSDACDATVGTKCDYFCNTGYQKNAAIITCETSTNWSKNPHLLCTNDLQCPYEIEHGDLDLSCRRIPGESCNYTCHEGYLPSETSPTREIRCESSLTWSKPLLSLCGKILCPTVIPHGTVSSECSREYKKYCHNYYCDNGYTEPPAAPGLRCNASGQWDWNEHQGNPCTRRDELCPSKIKNGNIVWHCHRQHGATCTYDCNSGCTENRSVSWLNCDTNSMWDKNTDTLCTCELGTTPAPNLCSHSIPNGHINRECDRRPFAACGYTCDDGCYKPYGALYCRSGSYWKNENTACICDGGRKTSEISAPTTTLSSCPKTIPNGYISVTCSRAPYDRCDYACYDGCRKMYYSLLCKSSGSWSSGGYACLCPVTETTPSSTSRPKSFSITIGVMVGVVALFVIIFVCGYLRIKKKRQHHQRNSYSQPAIHYYPPGVTGTNFNGVSNRNSTSVDTLPTQTDLNTLTQLPPSSEENSYTLLQPPNTEQNIQNPKPPEYSSITQPDSRDNPPPYELVMAYPADFKI